MQTSLIIALAIVAAVLLVAIIWMSCRRKAYSAEKITTIVRRAYAETGRDPNDLKIICFEEVQTEDAQGKSIYDIKIQFIGGDKAGKTYDFRYYLMRIGNGSKSESASGVITVENVTGAPSDSPLRLAN